MTVPVVTESTADHSEPESAQNPLANPCLTKDLTALSPVNSIRPNIQLNPAISSADDDECCYLLGYN